MPPKAQRGERSRDDRSWVVREGPRSAAERSFGPGTEPHPACPQSRRKLGRHGPLPELRARPRKQGGAAARPGPRRRPPRGAQEAARPCLPGPIHRVFRVVAPAAGGKLRAWAPGGPGGPCAALTVGELQEAKTVASEAPSTDSFLPKPTPQEAATAAAAAALAAEAQLPRLRNPRRRWRQLHFRSGHHFRSGPSPSRPSAVSSLGEQGTGFLRPPGRGADRGRRESGGPGWGSRRLERRKWGRGEERGGGRGGGEPAGVKKRDVRDPGGQSDGWGWAGQLPGCCVFSLGSRRQAQTARSTVYSPPKKESSRGGG